MKVAKAATRAILEALDPSTGGVYSAGCELVCEHLRKKGYPVEEEWVQRVLDQLVELGRVERVETDNGGQVYTRPEVLLRAAGLAEVAAKPRPPRDGAR